MPMHSAVVSEDIEQIVILAKAGADVNSKDKKGKTTLDIAEIKADKKNTTVNRHKVLEICNA